MLSCSGSSVAIVYVTDANYHDLTEYSLASFAIFSDQSATDVHIFQVDYDRELSPFLQRFLRDRGVGVRRHSLQSSAEELWAVRLHPHISIATAMKAHAVDQVARDAERLVFMDSDILVMRPISLAPLFTFETTLAGVFDFVSYMPFDGQDLISHTKRTGRSSDYMNAGFFLVDCEKWRGEAMFGRFVAALNEHETHCPYRHDGEGRDPGDCKGADQCALNMSAERDWTPLSLVWNVQKPVRHTVLWKDAQLRHYTGFRKFLARSNVNRDRSEYLLLQRIKEEVGLTPPEPITYDGGLLFMADRLKYTKETRRYSRVLAMLEHRREEALSVG